MPGGGITKALALTITDQPTPTITGVTLSVPSTHPGACPLIPVQVTGTNLYGTQAFVNGVLLQGSFSNTTAVVGGLPLGFPLLPEIFPWSQRKRTVRN
ncbi:MAG TPA: hypothetical protein VIJ38_09385 [Acidobacteriaceae bacterium]